MGTYSRSGRQARSIDARRSDDVPTLAPAAASNGQPSRVTTTSRGSSRRDATDDERRRELGQHVFHGCTATSARPSTSAFFDLFDEEPFAADPGERHVLNAIPVVTT